jgi:small neutral amino acid transporter SnatA (MarC family)
MAWSAEPDNVHRLRVVVVMGFYPMVAVIASATAACLWFNQNPSPYSSIYSPVCILLIGVLLACFDACSKFVVRILRPVSLNVLLDLLAIDGISFSVVFGAAFPA